MNASIRAEADVVQALACVLRVGLPKPELEDECRHLLELLQRLGLAAAELARARAYLALRKGDFAEGARALHAAIQEDGAGTGTSALASRALLAASLHAMGDAGAQLHAHAVLEASPDSDAAAFLRDWLEQPPCA